MVTVEFFGIPRQRAGRAELVVRANTVADVMASIKRACPGLADLVEGDGELAPHYLLSLDGTGFVKDLRQVLEPGTRVLLLSADAGG
jgi:molybdopterin converting factor small subunit